VQANCGNCGNRIVVDDSRVPDRPFSVKCPKCQAMSKFPGKAAAPPAADDAPPAAAVSHPASFLMESMGEQALSHLRSELTESGRMKGLVLVALSDPALGSAVCAPLIRLGFTSEMLENADDATRRLEQGIFDVVITSRSGGSSARGETLYQRVGRLTPDARRAIFLILVGEEFRTGDGTQAFALLADLLVHPNDVAAVEPVMLTCIAERNRLYQVFLQTKKRHEAAAT
jgi:predicted Zn finger-like uncharacterized protein